MSANDSTPRAAIPRRSRKRWGLLVAALVVVGIGAWLIWHRQDELQLDEINLSEADPEVATAIRRAQEKVLDNAQSAEAWGRLGMTLLANGFDAESDKPLRRAEELEPTNARWPYLQGIAYIGRSPDQAIPHFRRALQKCRYDEERGVVVLRLAETLAANGHTDEAETLFREVSAGPLTPCAEYGRGALAATRGQLAEARELLSRCAESPFTRRRAAIQLAAIKQREGESLPDLAISMPADAPWPDPFRESCMALAVGKQNRLRAIAELEQQGRLDKAIEELRMMVRDHPDAEVLLALGINLGRSGQHVESEDYLRQCLGKEPDRVRALYYLSLALFGQGESFQRAGQPGEAAARFQEAAKWARRATELAPHNGEAHFQLGLSEWCLEHRSNAIEAFRRAVATRPELVDAHLWLGKALLMDGQRDEAEKHFKDAMKFAPPNDIRPQQAIEELRRGKNS